MTFIEKYLFRFLLLLTAAWIAALVYGVLAIFQRRLWNKNKIFGCVFPLLSLFLFLCAIYDGIMNRYLNPFYFYSSSLLVIVIAVSTFIKRSPSKKTKIMGAVAFSLFIWLFFDHINIITYNVDIEDVQNQYALQFDAQVCSVDDHFSLTNFDPDVIYCRGALSNENLYGINIYISENDHFVKENILWELLVLKREEKPLTYDEWEQDKILFQVYQHEEPTGLEDEYIPYYRIVFSYQERIYEVYLHKDSENFTVGDRAHPQISSKDQEDILNCMKQLLSK